MYVLCSYSSGDVSVELHAHPDPFLPPVHAGQHGGTRFVMELPFLREGLDRTFDMCKVLFSSSSCQSEDRKPVKFKLQVPDTRRDDDGKMSDIAELLTTCASSE